MATPTSAVFTDPDVTLGEGDQFPWTQRLDGDWYTVVNDGRGPYTSIDNDEDRTSSEIVTNFGTRWNHKPFLVTDLDLSDLSAPAWTTAEAGYTDPPGANSPFYCFGCLAIGNDKLILNIALAEATNSGVHDDRDYNDPEPPVTWGGQAFAIWQDGAWHYADGVAHSSRNWSVAMPKAATTLTPYNQSTSPSEPDEFKYSQWTLAPFLQMGPGYQWNKDVGWESGNIRGYIMLYGPRKELDEHATSDTDQRETIMAMRWVGDDAENNPTDKLKVAFNASGWKVLKSVTDDVPTWDNDMSNANAMTVMSWPEKGTDSGQAWYPSTTYVKSLDCYLAIASSLQLTDYPTRASRVVVQWAPKPWGPWTDLWDSFDDNDDDLFLQEEQEDRVFSPMWGPIVDIDAETADVYVCFSGLGDVPPWDTAGKQRYGINWGKFRISTAGSLGTPTATDDAIAVTDGQSVDHDPRGNDLDPVGGGLTITAVTAATDGTASIIQSGTKVRYEHTEGEDVGGSDTFDYTIDDSLGSQDTATVTVTINATTPDLGASDIDPSVETSGEIDKAKLRANRLASRNELNHGGFYSAGGTGALVRAVQEREREFRLLTEFGTGTGTWADFLIAVDAVDFLVIPPGEYTWAAGGDSGLTGKTIWGHGAKITVTNKLSPTTWTGIKWHGVEFVGQTIEFMRGNDCSGWTFFDCAFRDFGISTIRTEGSTADFWLNGCSFVRSGKDIDPDPRPWRETTGGPEQRSGSVYHPEGITGLTVEFCSFFEDGGHSVHVYGRPDLGEGSNDMRVRFNRMVDPMFRGFNLTGSDNVAEKHPGYRYHVACNYIFGCGRRQPGPSALGGEQGSGVGCNGGYIRREAGVFERLVCGNFVDTVAENGLEGAMFGLGNVIRNSGWRFAELTGRRSGFATAHDGVATGGGAWIGTTIDDAGEVAFMFSTSTRPDIGISWGQASYGIALIDTSIIGPNRAGREEGSGRSRHGIDWLEWLGGGNANLDKCVVMNATVRGQTGQPSGDLALHWHGASGTTLGTSLVHKLNCFDIGAPSRGGSAVFFKNRRNGALT